MQSDLLYKLNCHADKQPPRVGVLATALPLSRTTQGLLIDLWYATLGIRYLDVGVLDNLITERRSWLICEGVKGFLILVSLVLFSSVSRHYCYRQRDEIVNVQAMIEAVYERRPARQQEYLAQQEHKPLATNNDSYNSVNES